MTLFIVHAWLRPTGSHEGQKLLRVIGMTGAREGGKGGHIDRPELISGTR